jgi:hypothetical protein
MLIGYEQGRREHLWAPGLIDFRPSLHALFWLRYKYYL